MVKRMKCDVCCGRGMTIPENHGGMVFPIKCKHCNGTGQIEVPKTNADRIRAMSDEELAEWMAECNAYREYADASQWLPWLRQPAKEDA